MGAVRRFEDLIAWQRARDLALEIYRATNHGEFARGFALKDQIRRAAISVMANVAEGFDRGGPREFHQYLVIAKGSFGEVRSLLYLANDIGHLDNEQFRALADLALESTRIINGLRAATIQQ